jgi:EmrB/QacA subfamily drug resistance transporter
MSPSHETQAISLPRRRAITAGLLLGMGLGALEATVVGTAMPTVIATLGGLAHYSWVFSAYLLTSTATVPIWGRLSDLYGRRRLYLAGIVTFLVGSALCGISTSMPQLIAARTIQGLGAGAIIPLSMTIIGEMYTLAERARTQAAFSSVWGIASVLGPLVGGYITDAVSWRWVFFLNLPLGALALVVIALAYPPRQQIGTVRVDWVGAALLFAGTSSLLIALSDDGGTAGWWFAAAAVLLIAFAVVEHRASDPLLPVDLFLNPLVARTCGVVFLIGASMFGSIAFIPLFVQAVMGGTATEAGQGLTPLFLGWVVMSVMAARLTPRVGYRRIAGAGALLLTAGSVALSFLNAHSSRQALLADGLLLGGGMGFLMLSTLLAVQHGVDRSRLGIATSLNQFSRSIGAAVGVAAMGALLTRSLSGAGMPNGLDGAHSSVPLLSSVARDQFATALQKVFILGALTSAAAFVLIFFLPRVDFSRQSSGPTSDRAATGGTEPIDRDEQPVGGTGLTRPT